MPVAEPITFYFEFASPYAYLAALRIDAAAARCGRSVDWKAVSLAHVLKARGVSRDGMGREKLDYIMRDAARAAEMQGAPFRMPTAFPVDSKAARQAFWRLKARDPALAVRFARAVYGRYWGEGLDVTTPEQIAQATAAFGVDLAEAGAALADPAARQAAIDATAEAIERGMFGAPAFIVDGELFWGQDRIDMIEWRLGAARAA
jgi:2-hydroxychromene-2-carboxylate isomerase